MKTEHSGPIGVHFSREHGRITLKAWLAMPTRSPESPSAKPAADSKNGVSDHDRELHVEIADDGVGIAEPYQESIFKAFFQVQGGRQDKAPGTGMGLFMARRLAELLGGRISVKSEGEGTVAALNRRSSDVSHQDKAVLGTYLLR
ncbi:MAG: hypothetical protein JEZ11_17595 [Desulfobacterales bacterium]|nr:hypothetical protein [Desulfobacterales bacterium]